jgi:hypothetical protein
MKRLFGCGVLALALTQAACQALSDGARQRFSDAFTCPPDRVEVRERPELHPSDWFKANKPSSEIAADPGRLKMWQAEQDRLKSYTERYRIFEARGCGHQSLYECARARKSYNTIRIQATCSRLDYLPDVAKW